MAFQQFQSFLGFLKMTEKFEGCAKRAPLKQSFWADSGRPTGLDSHRNGSALAQACRAGPFNIFVEKYKSKSFPIFTKINKKQ